MRIVEIFFAKAERGHPLKLTYLHTVVVVKIFTTNFLQLLACEATSQLLRSSRKNFWPQLHNYGLRGCCFEDESFLGVRLTTSSSKWGNIYKNRVKNERIFFFLKFLIFFSCEQGNLGVGC